MADRVEPEIEETNEEDDVTIVHVGEEVEEKEEDDGVPEDFRAKTPKELFDEIQRLREESNVAKTIARSITEAREDRPANLSSPPPPDLEKAQREWREFTENFDTNLLRTEKPSELIVQMLEKTMGPVMARTAESIAKVAKRALKADGETRVDFVKYEAEIDAYVKKQSPAEQVNPDVYDEAFRFVKAQHAPSASDIDALVAKKVAEELAKRGGGGGGSAVKTPFQGGSGGGGGAAKKGGNAIREQSWDKGMAQSKGIPLDSWLRSSARAKEMARRAGK